MVPEHAASSADENSDAEGNDAGSENGGGKGRIRAVLLSIVLSACGLAGGLVVAVIGIIALGAFGIDVFSGILLYPVGTILQGLGFGLVVAAYLTVSGRWDLVKVGVPSLRDLGWAVLGIVSLFVAVVAIGVVVSTLNVPTAQNRIAQVGAQNPEVLLYMIPLAFLVIGPGEELLFRGAVQGVIERSLGPVPAVVLASVLFAAAHAAALIGSASGVVATIAILFCLGAILGTVYERTSNLVVPSLVHGAYDAILFLGLYVQSAGALPGVL